MVETKESFQSSWTLAEPMIYQIATHLSKGRNFWLAGKVESYYWEFEAVVRVLQGILSEEEKLEAYDMEAEMVKCIPIKTPEQKAKLCILMKQYDAMIMTFIHKHKLDLPQKRDETKLLG